MKKLFDGYGIVARLFPAILCIVPALVLWFFVQVNVELRDLATFLLSIKFFGEVTLGVVALYFFTHILRATSKYFENKYFIRSRGFPTAYLMSYNDKAFSRDYKDKYRKLVKRHFDMDIFDEEQEKKDPGEARRLLDEATKQMILKVGDGQLVKKENTWYGFMRNLIGGTLFSMMFCIVAFVVGLTFCPNRVLVVVSVVLFVIYASVFLFRRRLLRQYAEVYGKQLIAEFMQLGT